MIKFYIYLSGIYLPDNFIIRKCTVIHQIVVFLSSAVMINKYSNPVADSTIHMKQNSLFRPETLYL